MECPGYGLGTLCGLFGYSRQSYYKWDSREFAENAVEPLIVEKVSEYRKNNPGLGCAKLYLIVRQLFENTGSMAASQERPDGTSQTPSSLQDDRLKTPLP